MSHAYQVAVIGGGQSGLAAAYHLMQLGLRTTVLDASPSAGHVWRSRWDSLTLLTPCPYNSLPGSPFPAPRWSFPHKDAVADYLDDYERRHRLPVRHETPVTGLRRLGERFALETSAGVIEASGVVLASGPFRTPAVPAMAAAAEISQLHSHDYRNPSQIPAGEVLVVGAGNSGAGIAQELAATHRVTLSLGRTASTPRRLLGRDVFWWAHLLRVTQIPSQSFLGRRMQRGPDGLIGASAAELAARHRFSLAPRTVAFAGSRAHFADGSSRQFSAVVWATGYRPSYPLLASLDRGLLDASGRPLHRGGLTPLAGLTLLGLPWQRHIDSSLLGGVGRDAAAIATHLAAYLRGALRPHQESHVYADVSVHR